MLLKALPIFLLFITIINAQIPISGTLTSSSTTNTTNTLRPYLDIFNCSCDYYTNVCDTYCCCDTDCTAAIRNSWTSQGLCVSTAETGQLFQKCPDTSLLKLLTSPKSQQAVELRQISTFFCIEYDMAPYAGYFYLENNSTSSATSLEKDFYTRNQAINTVASTTTTSTSYTDGDIVSGVSSVSSTVARSYAIPKSNMFGLCADTPALFLTDIPLSPCTRLVTFETELANTSSVLSRQYFLSVLLPKSTPQSSSTTITLTARNVTLLGSAANSDLAGTVGGSSACTAQNVVTSADVYLVFSEAGLVTSGFVDLVLQNIATSVCNVQTSVTQYYGLHYIMDSTAVPKSGNPGYTFGNPLLIGLLNTVTSNTVLRPITGFHVNGIATDGSCSLTAGALETRPDYIPKFGQNTTYSCSIDLSAVTGTGFQTLCTSLTTTYELYQNFPTGSALFGKFGSSNIHYQTDWVSVTNIAFDTAIYVTNNCTVSKDVELYVFYSQYGLSEEPLNYIISVYQMPSAMVSLNLETMSELPLSLSVKYIKVRQEDLS